MAEQIELVRLQDASCQHLPHPPIDHVNLVICRGELISLIGPDGSMKQSLLDLLIGRLAPLTGFRTVYPDTETETFGYAVGQQCLFEDRTVADNLLWLSNTRRKIIWSVAEEHRLARQIFQSYGLDLDPAAQVRTLSTFEKYALEVVKAIELFHVRLLILDNFHRLGEESEQRRLLQMTERFRQQGGAVVICSILRLKIFQETLRTYLLQNGELVRTYHNTEHTIYRAHTEAFWNDPGSPKLTPMEEAPVFCRADDYVLQIQMNNRVKSAWVGPGEVLGIYADRVFEDSDIRYHLRKGHITLKQHGKQFPIRDLPDLSPLGFGYFPKQIEKLLFYSLNYAENVEIFAYRKLCRIPGILSRKLERYFLSHCIQPEPQLHSGHDLSQIRHSSVLQIAIDRYRQRTWKFLFIHIPAFVYTPTEYQMMQNFISEQQQKQTAIVILSRDRHGLSRFCSRVVSL